MNDQLDNDQLDIDTIRKNLEKQRGLLLEKISVEEAKLVPKTSQNPDRSSLAMEYATHERDLALYEKDHYQLDQINTALKRIKEGVYGRCENCGDAINPARLDVLPYATLCIGCQMKQEMR